MTKTAFTTMIATLISLAITGVAIGADAPSFDEIDANDDGTISKSEAAAVPDLDFAAADTNQDGVLTKSEYGAATG